MQLSPSLQNWLTQTNLSSFNITPLAGDASFRRYFRLQNEERSFILMDAHKERASCIPFVSIAKTLRDNGLNTPTILAHDLSQGYILLEDFGDDLFLSQLNNENAQSLYRAALDSLDVLQKTRQVRGWILPIFTARFMRQELALFQEWFLEKHLQLQLSLQTQQMLASCFDFLVENAASQTKVFMHRDFHSANLMVLPQNQVGILDFQDAFLGPVTYDLVSLLRDCYITWPEPQVLELVHYYWEKLAIPDVSRELFLRWFDLMGLQRHMKALLTFSRKYHRDHNANYLQHIPRTLQYILQVSQRYPECQPLHNFLQQTVKEQCVL